MLILAFYWVQFLIYSVQSDLYCNNATDCKSIYNSMNTTERIILNGYTSGTLNGSITSTNNIHCSGAYSCEQTHLVTAQIRAEGSYSVYNSSLITSTNDYVDCPALKSCAYSHIQVGTYIYCGGVQSCSYATITARRVFSGGAYSLENATIYSTDNEDFEVVLNGYNAGFGTTIICQMNHSCPVTCDVNSCKYFNELQCLGNNPICSITYSSQPQSNTSTDILLYDSLTTIANSNINCDKPGSIAYDTLKEHYNQPNSIVDAAVVPAVCCRGTQSCMMSDFEYNGTLICSAAQA
eukprot:281572_1